MPPRRRQSQFLTSLDASLGLRPARSAAALENARKADRALEAPRECRATLTSPLHYTR